MTRRSIEALAQDLEDIARAQPGEPAMLTLPAGSDCRALALLIRAAYRHLEGKTPALRFKVAGAAVGSTRNPKHPRHGVAASALRAAGYAPAPRVWLPPEDMELVLYMAQKHEPDVDRIKAEAMADMRKEQR